MFGNDFKNNYQNSVSKLNFQKGSSCHYCETIIILYLIECSTLILRVRNAFS